MERRRGHYLLLLLLLLATEHYTERINRPTRSPMGLLGRGSPGCKDGVEIPAHRRPQTSPKVVQLIASSEFTVIRPGRLSQHNFLSFR